MLSTNLKHLDNFSEVALLENSIFKILVSKSRFRKFVFMKNFRFFQAIKNVFHDPNPEKNSLLQKCRNYHLSKQKIWNVKNQIKLSKRNEVSYRSHNCLWLKFKFSDFSHERVYRSVAAIAWEVNFRSTANSPRLISAPQIKTSY